MTDRLGPALAEALRIAYDDAAADWFPPLRPTVDALPAAEASVAGPGLNAPWQVLEHLRIGMAVWGTYLADGRFDPAAFGGGREWEPVADVSEAAWDALRAQVGDLEASFRAVVAGLPDAALWAPDPVLGGSTRLDIVLSTLVHLGFHAGELATLASARRREAHPEGGAPAAASGGG